MPNASRRLVCFFPLMLAACLLAIGCQTKWRHFDAAYRVGAYQEAVQCVWDAPMRSQNRQKPGYLLEHLQGGAALRADGQLKASNQTLDDSEAITKHYDERLAAMTGADYLASILVNDSVMPYQGETYDKIMINTYKALNFMMLGDRENARVELNRAYERQGLAVKQFARQIQREHQAVASKQAELGNNLNLSQTLDNPQLQKLTAANYSNLDQWAVYPDFVNPFTTYLHGLFALLAAQGPGDLENASEFLKRAVGMTPGNHWVAEDFMQVESMLNGKLTRAQIPPTVWVIFENGLGPVKRPVRLDIPLFLATDKILYTGIAFPVLELQPAAYPYLLVGGPAGVKTEPVGSMDGIVATEFKKELPGLVVRCVLRTLLKTYAQYEMQKQLGDAGGISMALYQLATNTADTRIWSALPKNFQVARVETPADRILRIAAPGDARELLAFKIPEGRFALACIKITQPGVRPVCQITTFK